MKPSNHARTGGKAGYSTSLPVLRIRLMRRILKTCPVLLILGAAACVSTSGLSYLPTDAPRPAAEATVERILADLVMRDAHIRSVRCTGAVLISGLTLGAQNLRARVAYEEPAELYLRGDKRPFGVKVFELTASGSEWRIHLPAENQTIYSDEALVGRSGRIGRQIELARELFSQEDWADLPVCAVRVVRPRHPRSCVELVIRKNGLSRRVWVAGTPWRVLRSELRTRLGRRIAVVGYAQFQSYEGVEFPREIRAEFPPMGVRIVLSDLSPRFNGPADAESTADAP